MQWISRYGCVEHYELEAIPEALHHHDKSLQLFYATMDKEKQDLQSSYDPDFTEEIVAEKKQEVHTLMTSKLVELFIQNNREQEE